VCLVRVPCGGDHWLDVFSYVRRVGTRLDFEVRSCSHAYPLAGRRNFVVRAERKGRRGAGLAPPELSPCMPPCISL